MRASRLLVLLLLAAPAVGTGAVAGEETLVPRVDPRVAPLLPWLGGEDPVLRALAAFELRRHAEDGTVRLAADALASETDPIVLACLLGSLQGRARADLVAEGGALLPGLLLRLVEDPFEPVRERAWAVMEGLRPDTAGKDPDAWRRWWIGARAALEEEQQAVLRARREARAAAPRAVADETGETTPPPEDDLYGHVEKLRREGLDLVVAIDKTGSMLPWIAAAKARAAVLVERLSWLVPRFRAGLITYDDGARLRIALTTDAAALAKVFGKVGAGGGADWEEGVDKAILLALRQDQVGWSRKAWRVIVVIGDAPPHAQDVAGMLRAIEAARDDVLYDHGVVVHTVSTSSMGVPHFGQIARAGAGVHVTLSDAGRLVPELVALAFGDRWRDRVGPWLDEIQALRKAARRRE